MKEQTYALIDSYLYMTDKSDTRTRQTKPPVAQELHLGEHNGTQLVHTPQSNEGADRDP